MTLSSYILAAMAEARYKILPDRSYQGHIPGLRGVWANEPSLEGCRHILQEVLEDWIVLKLRDGDPLPKVHGKTLRIPQPARA